MTSQQKEFLKNTFNRFFPSILIGTMKIDYKGKIISAENIKEILIKERIFEKWLSFFDEVYTMPDNKKHFISDVEKYNFETVINLDEIGDDKLEKIKHDYFEKTNCI